MRLKGSEVVLVVQIADDAVRIDVAHLDASRRCEFELGSCHALEKCQVAWERIIVKSLKATMRWTAEKDHCR